MEVTFFGSGGLLGSYWLELAVAPWEQERGMMHRDRIAAGYGMLFPYPHDRMLSFWMEQTWVPLDMIFVNDAGVVVHIVHQAAPRTQTPRSSQRPARYVIELAGGEASRLGLGAGDRVAWMNLPQEHLPRTPSDGRP